MTFILKDTVRLDDKKCDALVFQHESGMRHIHINSTFPEMSFVTCFPTATTDNTGMPHILEHLVMCGSQDYPQNDPFFSMTRRSVAHDLNAMTDRAATYYRFATTDPKDFSNLSDLYLDLAFRPLLRKKDFLREGWRLERGERGEPKLNGVVLNEMLGAYSNPDRHIVESMITIVGEGTAAEKMSGGHPLSIAALDYESLKTFYWSRYFHGTAVVVTAGPVDVESFQEKLAKTISKLPQRIPSEPSPNGVGLGRGVSPEAKFEFGHQEAMANGQVVKHLFIPAQSNKPSEAVWLWRGDYRPGSVSELEDQMITAAMFDQSNPEFLRLGKETSLSWSGGLMFDSLARHGGKLGIYLSCSGVSEDQLADLDKHVQEFFHRSMEAGVSEQAWEYSITKTQASIRTRTPMHNLAISMAGLAVNNLPLDCDTNNIKAADALLEKGPPGPEEMMKWWARFESAGIIMTHNDPDMMMRWNEKLDEIARHKASIGVPFTDEKEILGNENEDESVLPRVTVGELNPVIEPMASIKVIPAHRVGKDSVKEAKEAALSMPSMSSLWIEGSGLTSKDADPQKTATLIHIHSPEDEKSMRVEVQFDCQNLLPVERLALSCLEVVAGKVGSHAENLEEKTQRVMRSRAEVYISTKPTRDVPGNNPWTFSLVGILVDPQVGCENILGALTSEMFPNLNDEDFVHALQKAEQEMGSSLDWRERQEEEARLEANADAASAGEVETNITTKSLLDYMAWAKENPSQAREQIFHALTQVENHSPRRVLSVGDDRVLERSIEVATAFSSTAAEWQMIIDQKQWTPGASSRGHVHMPGGSHNVTRIMATPNLRDDRMMMLAAQVTAKLAGPYLHTQIREKGGAYGSGMRVSSHAIKLMSRNDPSADQSYEAFTQLSQWVRNMANSKSHEALEQAKIGVARDLVNPERGLVGLMSAKRNTDLWRPVDYTSSSLRNLDKIGWEQIMEVADLLDPTITPFQDITVGPHEPEPLPGQGVEPEQRKAIKVR